MSWNEEELAYCDFCGKDKTEALLVEGPNVHICHVCAVTCISIFHDAVKRNRMQDEQEENVATPDVVKNANIATEKALQCLKEIIQGVKKEMVKKKKAQSDLEMELD